MALLEVEDLVVEFRSDYGDVRASDRVTEVSLGLERGETLGLVGESGCGKSTLARCTIALESADAGEVQERLGLTYLFISHDLHLVRYVSGRIAVMYFGRIVELGPAGEVSERPRHPYTQLLLAAVPQPDPALRDESVEVTGEVPSPFDPPSGCTFHPRCPLADERCVRERPELRRVAPDIEVACHRYEQTRDPVPALTMVSKTED